MQQQAADEVAVVRPSVESLADLPPECLVLIFCAIPRVDDYPMQSLAACRMVSRR